MFEIGLLNTTAIITQVVINESKSKCQEDCNCEYCEGRPVKYEWCFFIYFIIDKIEN